MSVMKYLAAIATLTFALSLGAFAKDSNSGKFDLAEPAHIGSALLQPGQYKAVWSGSDNALNIAILSHGKTVATVKGQLKELPTKTHETSISTRARQDKSRQVDEIDFSNRSEALTFAGS